MPIVWAGAASYHYEVPIGTVEFAPVIFSLDVPGHSYSQTGLVIIGLTPNTIPYFGGSGNLNELIVTTSDGTSVDLLIPDYQFRGGNLAGNNIWYFYSPLLGDGVTISATITYGPHIEDVESYGYPTPSLNIPTNDLLADVILCAALLDVDTRIYFNQPVAVGAWGRNANGPDFSTGFTGYSPATTETIGMALMSLRYNADDTGQAASPYLAVPYGTDELIGGGPSTAKYGAFVVQSSPSTTVTFAIGAVSAGRELNITYAAAVGAGFTYSLTISFYNVNGGLLLESTVYPLTFPGFLSGRPVAIVNGLIIPSANLLGGGTVYCTLTATGIPSLSGQSGQICYSVSNPVSNFISTLGVGQVVRFAWNDRSWMRTITAITDDTHASIDAPLPYQYGQPMYEVFGVEVPADTSVAVGGLHDIQLTQLATPFANIYPDYLVHIITNTSGNGAAVWSGLRANDFPNEDGSVLGDLSVIYNPIFDGQTSIRVYSIVASQYAKYFNSRIFNASDGTIWGSVDEKLIAYYTPLDTRAFASRPATLANEATFAGAPYNSDWQDEFAVTNGTSQAVVASYHGGGAVSFPDYIPSSVQAGDPVPPPPEPSTDMTTSAVTSYLAQPQQTNYGVLVSNSIELSDTLYGAGYSNNPVMYGTGFTGVYTGSGSGILGGYYPEIAALQANPLLRFCKVVCSPGDVSNSNMSAIALTEGGQVFTWGRGGIAYRNLQQGREPSPNGNQAATLPTLVPTLSEIVDIDISIDGAMALDVYGNAWAWGANTYGSLGTGQVTYRNGGSGVGAYPLPMIVGTNIREISCGFGVNYLTTRDGRVLTAGANGLGTGHPSAPYFYPDSSVTPFDGTPFFAVIPGLSGVRKAMAGGNFGAFLMRNGTVRACGASLFGQTGFSLATADGLVFDVPEAGGGLVDISPLRVAGNQAGQFDSSSRPAIWGLTSAGTMQLLGAFNSLYGCAGDGLDYGGGGDGLGNLAFALPNPILLPEGVTCAALPRWGGGTANGVGIQPYGNAGWQCACVGSDGMLYTWGTNLYNSLVWPGPATSPTNAFPTPTAVPGTFGVGNIGPGNFAMLWTTGIPFPPRLGTSSLQAPVVIG